MQKKYLFFIGFILLFITLTLSACGGGSGDSDGDDPKFLSILTGGTSGTYYPLGGEMQKTIEDETGIEADSVASNASADNIADLEAEEAEIAFTQTDVMSNAIEGINSFDEPVDDILAMGSLYPETIQIVTTEDTGIETVDDLEGHKVSVGAPGSGTYVNAEQILDVYGLDIEDDINASDLDFEESVDDIKDGNIDASFITAGTPTGAVEDLNATDDVKIVEVEEDKADELIAEHPYYTDDTVEEGTYDLDEDVNTVAVLAMLAVREDVPEDTVYDITKAIYENADSMSHDKAKEITPDSGLDGIGMDLHPGAEKYFDEEGIEKDDD